LNTKGRKDISLVEKVTNIHKHCQNMGSQRWRFFLCSQGGSPPWNADLWNPECLVGCWMTFANRRSLVQHYHQWSTVSCESFEFFSNCMYCMCWEGGGMIWWVVLL
jgi:hypothetical protein